ncbi:MAG: tetratricopeptide repeat protein [Butyricicoccus sp.]|nr:tetratricopeptide repeat protein [Butyricicoccus sp.]MBQ8584982.1 tetratricopeptide repeat protein [Butyricicoccus sp.]
MREDPRELIRTYNDMGACDRECGCYEESISAFQKARALIEEEYGQDCEQYAVVLNNMAGSHRLAGEYMKALHLFCEAVAVYERIGRQDSWGYISVMNNLVLMYRDNRQLKDAIRCQKRVIAILEKNPASEYEAAISYSDLAALYCEDGQMDEARGCVERALQVFRADPAPRDLHFHYAAALNSLAGFRYADGDGAGAAELYQWSAAYTKRFFGENIEYAMTCQSMHWAYRMMGECGKAVEILNKAAVIFAEQLGIHHERTRMAAEELRRLKNCVCF